MVEIASVSGVTFKSPEKMTGNFGAISWIFSLINLADSILA